RSQPAEATTQLVGRAPGGSTQPARNGTSVLGGHREPDRSRYRVMGVNAGTQEVVVAAHHRRDGPDWRAARVRPGIGVGTVHLHDLLRQPDEIDLASRADHPAHLTYDVRGPRPPVHVAAPRHRTEGRVRVRQVLAIPGPKLDLAA